MPEGLVTPVRSALPYQDVLSVGHTQIHHLVVDQFAHSCCAKQWLCLRVVRLSLRRISNSPSTALPGAFLPLTPCLT